MDFTCRHVSRKFIKSHCTLLDICEYLIHSLTFYFCKTEQYAFIKACYTGMHLFSVHCLLHVLSILKRTGLTGHHGQTVHNCIKNKVRIKLQIQISIFNANYNLTLHAKSQHRQDSKLIFLMSFNIFVEMHSPHFSRDQK